MSHLEPETVPAAKRYIPGQVPHSVCARVTSNVPVAKGRSSLPFRSPLNWKVVSSQPSSPFSPPASVLRLRNAGPLGGEGGPATPWRPVCLLEQTGDSPFSEASAARGWCLISSTWSQGPLTDIRVPGRWHVDFRKPFLLAGSPPPRALPRTQRDGPCGEHGHSHRPAPPTFLSARPGTTRGQLREHKPPAFPRGDTIPPAATREGCTCQDGQL